MHLLHEQDVHIDHMGFWWHPVAVAYF